MSFTFRQGDLPKLDLQVDRGTDLKAWKVQWQAYFSLSGLDEQPAAKQVQALTLCFSRETICIVDNLGLSAEQRAGVDTIIEAIERYVQGQINETKCQKGAGSIGRYGPSYQLMTSSSTAIGCSSHEKCDEAYCGSSTNRTKVK